MTDRIVQIPFGGFYESRWDYQLDSELEMECEYLANETESNYPEKERLSVQDFLEIIWTCVDYGGAYRCIAESYAESFDDFCSNLLGIETAMRYESMSSPREYNFATDRIFCHIPESTVLALFALSEKNGHAGLTRMLQERHTSYSGFHSFYSNDLSAWLAKPVMSWDHNELASLLMGCLVDADAGIESVSEIEDSIFDLFLEGEIGNALWNNFDREEFSKLSEEMREEKRMKANPESEKTPARCETTGDLFES